MQNCASRVLSTKFRKLQASFVISDNYHNKLSNSINYSLSNSLFTCILYDNHNSECTYISEFVQSAPPVSENLKFFSEGVMLTDTLGYVALWPHTDALSSFEPHF